MALFIIIAILAAIALAVIPTLVTVDAKTWNVLRLFVIIALIVWGVLLLFPLIQRLA